MPLTYKHGTYGEFAESIGGVATQSGTLAVYVGTAPVNLIQGYAEADVVNSPVLLTDFAAVKRLMGYSSNWTGFSLCEAFKVHFDNPEGNAGPIVAINVLDPAVHKKSTQTTKEVTFVNKRATFSSDTIVLDSLVLADKVKGTDFTVDYSFTTGQVILTDISSAGITETIQATFDEVDLSKVTKTEIIGGVTSGGVYSGLGCIDLVYSETNLIPSLIVAPGWSDIPEVYNAMITAGTKINGHWDAFVVADLPIVGSGSEAIDTIDKAIAWAEENNYKSERSKVFWSQAVLTFGGIAHGSTLFVWRQLLVDASHDGIPMETASNKEIPVSKQYFGETSKNRGFDQSRANDLNTKGISTIVYWGGRWVLWGGHTAAYEFGNVADNRAIFDNSIRTMMYITNSFQQEWAVDIDEPMTRAKADTIKAREQEKADALVAVGALIGAPEVLFLESENSTAELTEGNFVWDFRGTPTPQWKSGTLRVAYTDAGFSTYFGEEV